MELDDEIDLTPEEAQTQIKLHAGGGAPKNKGKASKRKGKGPQKKRETAKLLADAEKTGETETENAKETEEGGFVVNQEFLESCEASSPKMQKLLEDLARVKTPKEPKKGEK